MQKHRNGYTWKKPIEQSRPTHIRVEAAINTFRRKGSRAERCPFGILEAS